LQVQLLHQQLKLNHIRHQQLKYDHHMLVSCRYAAARTRSHRCVQRCGCALLNTQ
jgi:hypothetical protein